MGTINMTRVLLGGLAAGVIINISEGILNGVVLAQQWKEHMTKFNLPGEFSVNQSCWFSILGFVIGILTVWLYAAIRPRYGAGPKTAMWAGSFVWMLGYALAMAYPTIVGLLPADLTVISPIWGLVEILVASVLGAKVYKEESAASAMAAAAQ